MRRSAPLLLLLSLAACGRSVALTDATLGEVAEAAVGVVRQQPGRWEQMTELQAIDPGKSAGDRNMAAVMRQQVGQQDVAVTCLTPEMADLPPFGNAGAASGAACRFARFRLGGGTVDARMECRGRDGGRLTVTQAGDYEPARYDLTVTVDRRDGAGANLGQVRTRLIGRRTGACAR